LNINQLIGTRIRQLRTKRKMSGAAFGIRLGPYLGEPWTRQTVYEAETGKRDFRITELIALALAANIQVHHLVDGNAIGEKLELAKGKFISAEDLADLFKMGERKAQGPVFRAFVRNREQLKALQAAWANAAEADRQLSALFPDFPVSEGEDK